MSRGPKRQIEEIPASPQIETGAEWVVLGRVSGLYGVRGWVRIYSHTSPRDNILKYSPWYLQRAGRWEKVELKAGRVHGKGVVAQLDVVGAAGTERAARVCARSGEEPDDGLVGALRFEPLLQPRSLFQHVSDGVRGVLGRREHGAVFGPHHDFRSFRRCRAGARAGEPQDRE